MPRGGKGKVLRGGVMDGTDAPPPEEVIIQQQEMLNDVQREFRFAHGRLGDIRKALKQAKDEAAREERLALARKTDALTKGSPTSWKRIVVIVVLVLAVNWRNLLHMKAFFDDPTPAGVSDEPEPWHGARGGPRKRDFRFPNSDAGFNPNPGAGANPDPQGTRDTRDGGQRPGRAAPRSKRTRE